jgi:hypothetical protein
VLRGGLEMERIKDILIESFLEESLGAGMRMGIRTGKRKKTHMRVRFEETAIVRVEHIMIILTYHRKIA